MDGQPEGELFQAEAVPGILVVDAVHLSVEHVHVDTPPVNVHGAVPLVELTR